MTSVFRIGPLSSQADPPVCGRASRREPDSAGIKLREAGYPTDPYPEPSERSIPPSIPPYMQGSDDTDHIPTASALSVSLETPGTVGVLDASRPIPSEPKNGYDGSGILLLYQPFDHLFRNPILSKKRVRAGKGRRRRGANAQASPVY